MDSLLSFLSFDLSVWFAPDGHSDTLWIALWALLFGYLTLIGPRLMLASYANPTALVVGGVAGSLIHELGKKPFERNYPSAVASGAALGLLAPLLFVLIGPVGLYYLVGQPLLHRIDADRTLCCLEAHLLGPKDWQITHDGRHLVAAGEVRQPLLYSVDRRGLVYAVDLERGRFLDWPGAPKESPPRMTFAARDIHDIECVRLSDDGRTALVNYEDRSGRPKVHSVSLARLGSAATWAAVAGAARYRLEGFSGQSVVLVDRHTGSRVSLPVDPTATQAMMSPGGTVLAAIVFPPKDDWSLRGAGRIEFWDVERGRRLRTYAVNLMPESNRLRLKASPDGKRWVLIANDTVKVFEPFG
jgi:hypothetical protein